ncbi:hypothetical protein WHY42_11755 [Clostridium perfringens]|uniref:hypothetical protein n=1 Tax=Clostridium perfringens TaxID=1502 RepID=UPI0018E429DE|nr:hypothetical protein [Clostridium perfringens]MBI6009996.1 hypothetical protein [Clostridium perfringens]MDU6981714.1 hypothetical protein [Clostridium perfringens]
MREENKPLKEYLLIKSNLIETIIIALVLAFGVSIIVSSITLIEGYSIKIGIAIGILLCIAALVYLVLRNSSKLKIEKCYKGFIYYNNSKKKIVEVPRYDFSYSVSNNLESVFQENIALEKMWNKDSLDECIKFDEKLKRCTLRKTKSSTLLIESIEYYILDNLSTHLTDYFNKDEFNETDLKIFKRNELPEVLLSNRVLEIFSKPMDERACFVDVHKESNEEHGKTICLFKNGFMFKEFDLVLPKGSKVIRNEKGQIQISTKRFKMNIDIIFDGTSYVPPSGFEEYYMNINNPIKSGFKSYNVKINITVKFNYLYLFTIRKWKYYSWIDSFINELDEKISSDSYFERIRWENTLTIIECMNRLNKESKNVNNIKQEYSNNINRLINELCYRFLEDNEHINFNDLKYMKEYVLRNRSIKSKLIREEITRNYIEVLVEKNFKDYIRNKKISI